MMKKGITLFILMLFVFQNAGSIWIIGDFYINRDYIAKNVCINRFDAVPICNGKCYLDNKLKANDKQEQKFPTVTYKEVQLFFESPFEFSFTTIRFAILKKYPVLLAGSQKSDFIFSIYHPPRCD
ncbi:hypothetical protein [Flavobacterium hercynium]|nr:hypothetical protein [Flavobacterium hercynium]SMP33949.1 hypothetical protein SAMN06265346_11756 [Flavobacterium hercynium]